MIVLDASLVVSWILLEDKSHGTSDLYKHAISGGAIGPSIFEIEVTNALRTNLRRRKITLAERNEALNFFARMNVAISNDQPSLAGIVALSDRHDLTTYDASYVALAQKHGALLATLDEAMARAARAEGLTVLP